MEERFIVKRDQDERLMNENGNPVEFGGFRGASTATHCTYGRPAGEGNGFKTPPRSGVSSVGSLLCVEQHRRMGQHRRKVGQSGRNAE